MSEARTPADQRGVDVAGPADGDPVVFLHGVMFTRKHWAPQREALADEFRVIVPDLPGHASRSGEPFRLERALGIVEEVVDDVADGSATVVGLSLGGYVATAFARRNPEKVDALVVSGASANLTGTMETLTRAVSTLSDFVTRSDLVDRGISWVAKRWVQSRDLPPAVEAEIVDAGIYPREFGRAGFELAGRDFRQAIAAYPGPALVCNGQWDLVNRLGEDEHAAAARNGDMAVIPHAGHVVNLEEPEEYTALVRRVARAAA